MWHSIAIIIANALLASSVWALPDGFVYVDQEIPGIRVELLYASGNNFCLLYTSPSPRDS